MNGFTYASSLNPLCSQTLPINLLKCSYWGFIGNHIMTNYVFGNSHDRKRTIKYSNIQHCAEKPFLNSINSDRNSMKYSINSTSSRSNVLNNILALPVYNYTQAADLNEQIGKSHGAIDLNNISFLANRIVKRSNMYMCLWFVWVKRVFLLRSSHHIWMWMCVHVQLLYGWILNVLCICARTAGS